ncbi:MAG: Asp-tRNA(Asn)/Glu-tRNA(Gln) amidotransferase subunit GatA [Burkholderiales bacterium]|nr:Asp-tRNA(Asn)/Glu-tRNA(Gln) amidotransferase subunit GatA [Burkholderiales bacterium]
MTDLTQATVAELSSLLSAKKVSSEEVTKAYLQKIEDTKKLNAYLDVRPEVSLAQAKEADKKIAAGEAGPLAGVPIAHKDIFVTKEWASTAASKMLDGYMSPFDATVVEKLKEINMVCLGKTNCDEFAMGSTTANSAYGKTYNPWDKNAVPGGSSGGASSCVAARIAPVATGTDTGGSIRQPSAFCGVTGIKPTYGRPSRWGMIAFASSLDTAGIIAQTAEDCALVLSHIIGFDKRDSTSIELPPEDLTVSLNDGVKGLRIGVPRKWLDKVAPGLKAALNDALRQYQELGAVLVDIDLPTADLGVPVYYIIAPAEASSNLSRFDGVRYGHRAQKYDDLLDMIKRSRDEGFGPEPKRRILIGTYVLSHGYYDAYYIKAQQVRRLIAQEFDNTFKNSCDVIFCPVSTDAAFSFDDKSDPLSLYLSDLFTVPGSLAGLPSMSVPCGISSNNRPYGFQLIGAKCREAQLLGVAHAYQQVTDWHKKVPAGY